MKQFQDLGFSDRFMFGKVMEDPVLCRRVLETLLHPTGTSKIYYNTTAGGSDIPKVLQNLFDYINTGTVSDKLTGEIETMVDRTKLDRDAFREYMMENLWRNDAIREVRWEGLNEGRAEGRAEGRTEVMDSLKTAKADFEAGVDETMLAEKYGRDVVDLLLQLIK